MHKIAFSLAIRILIPVYLILGLPLVLVAPSAFWYNADQKLEQQAEKVAESLERDRDYVKVGGRLYRELQDASDTKIYLRISPPATKPITYGKPIRGFTLEGQHTNSSGMNVLIIKDGVQVLKTASTVVIGIVLAMLLVGVLVLFMTYRLAHKIAKPLVFLSAQAGQLGTGKSRSIQLKTGIEEMDLVSAEMSRASQRFTSQLAQQRQFAADVTHQLRTPLASISMRLEEIKFLSEADSAIDQECDECIAQVERMNEAMETLKQLNNEVLLGKTEAIDMDELFMQQAQEWKKQFKVAARKLIFNNPVSDRHALATPGSLSQALATLIENALKYGAGTVSVTTRNGSTSRSMFIEITDEGEGIPEEISGTIFNRGVSGSGSTGIGLALAKELVEADGGRLELTQKQPPVFTISLCALPASYVHLSGKTEQKYIAVEDTHR